MIPNNIYLYILLIFIIYLNIYEYYSENFGQSSQNNADYYYKPEVCNKACCTLGNWKLPFIISSDIDLTSYTLVGSCMNGCRCKKIN